MKEFDKTVALLRELGLFDPDNTKHQRALRKVSAQIKAQEEREDQENYDRDCALLGELEGSPGGDYE